MTTIAKVYETRAGQTDTGYRAWLTDVNYWSQMLTGAPIYGHGLLTAEKMRRWYLAGIDAYGAMQRIARL